MPQRHREAYPPEFKAKLIALVVGGRSPEELADVKLLHGVAPVKPDTGQVIGL